MKLMKEPKENRKNVYADGLPFFHILILLVHI
jgi:hypothetical protein